jgi:hypothetical protein
VDEPNELKFSHMSNLVTDANNRVQRSIKHPVQLWGKTMAGTAASSMEATTRQALVAV